MPAAIVVATVLLRAALLPLSLRGYRAERVRARLAPQLEEIRRRHGKEPVVAAEKTSELLRREGSGPFAGFVPMLAQAPFVWLLYREFTGNSMHGYTLLGGDLTARLVAHPGLLMGWGIVAVLVCVAVWNLRQVPAGTPLLVRVLAFGTVAVAPFVPVAAGVYLVTSGVWTAVERRIFRGKPVPTSG